MNRLGTAARRIAAAMGAHGRFNSRPLLAATSLLALVGVGSLAQAQAPELAPASPSITAVSSDEAWARADEIAGRMTREEKLRYVFGYFPPMSADKPADMIPSAGYVPGTPRLNVPTLRESDASLGVANQVEQRRGDVATALPSSLALAASFSPELAYQGGAMIGSEARAKTFNVLLAGGINLTRDPWGGRTFEYLGEDPLVSGILGGESIRGVQSNGIVSTVKHMALNSQETGRAIVDARIGEAALRESDLLAFQIAIERGQPGSVMCAYNKVNGDWSCENDFLLNRVLKSDWGYRGWVMSDWGGVHSTVKAANAGLDQQSGRELDTAMFFGDPLEEAVEAGTVPEARLHDMVRRILFGVISSGLMDRPTPASAQPIDYAANAEVAQRVAEAGIVLLKNDGGVLPFAKTARKVVLIGGRADVGVLSGGGSSQVRSVGGAPVEIPLTEGAAASFARVTWHASSPLNAIRALLPDADVSYVDGSDPAAAAAAARDADLAVLFATQWRSEAQDIYSLALPDNQDALIDAVAAANRRTVVVMESGGPVLMPWIDRVPAVLQAWYPGQRGGEAIARILFGDVNPSGHMPMTFLKDASQTPRPDVPGLDELRAAEARRSAGDTANYGQSGGVRDFSVTYTEGADVGYRWFDKQGLSPLFAFGHGLSYTRFSYSDLRIVPGDNLAVTFTVTNTGRVAGADVPQVYARAGRRDGPSLRLVGFQRVELAPGESRQVSVTIDPRILADYDPAQPGWHIAAGDYPVIVAESAAQADLAAGLTATARLADRRLRP
ncbi:beta-glucosidase [Sphingomonas jejuensis]|uniref:Beta-glucosidase n=2 Tax=Sphingomonas jejuensis TaxID=904715 RepID=A0ABX0XI85_9SPHN|nr:beta-glucosidase [Sphingomonas jejuensis]